MEPNLFTKLTKQLKLARADLNQMQHYGDRKEFLRRWMELDNELQLRIKRDETLKPLEPAVLRFRKHVNEKLTQYLYPCNEKRDGQSSKH